MRGWQGIGLAVSVALWGWVVGCKQTPTTEPVKPEPPVTPSTGTPLNWQKPANFPDPTYDFANNPLTKEGVLLGRTLFYDALLSKDGTISCAFCHSPFTGFSHTDHPLSHGIRDQTGTRNVPGIQNLAWRNTFFWDGGIIDLDLLPIAPIQNPIEMDETFPNVLTKVRTSGRYRPLFRAAFGSDSISSDRFLKALSQFMLTMVSSNSTYDKVARKEGGAALTEAAQRGLTLFQQKCASCHKEPFFTDQGFRNNGLPQLATAKIDDKGRYAITAQDADLYKFRVPSLRNVEFTPPYMHDGRFSSLQQVLRHYATGVQDSPYLDPLLKQNGQVGIPMTVQEQNDIISFLYTLTDYTFLQNPDLQPLR
ncbi:cytochrome c peroxidase [Fibrella aestuarina BUZ 2]|uniref:Cytochrome c peroxidase n=1 Tax=Fibrella aestuarina BUZ 2 TaxID=1166018 RepID=I0KDS3_9BACT|nr:cytochrome c peroxidase [Fibrella aestuarina]CCH02276.1 cytochrome c peroxidase [Fibrella aestuarina BUZ 2]